MLGPNYQPFSVARAIRACNHGLIAPSQTYGTLRGRMFLDRQPGNRATKFEWQSTIRKHLRASNSLSVAC